MNIDFLIENSQALTNSMNESIDVSDTDEIVNAVIEQKQYSSLAYSICEVSPIHGPTGATFALVYVDDPARPGKKKVQLLRGEVLVEDDAIEDTGFTTEAIQDIQTQFGKSAINYIGRVFGNISSTNENLKLIQKMSTFSAGVPSLTLTDPKNAETSIFEIQQKVAETVLLINGSSYKSLDSFVVLPLKAASSMLAVSNRLPDNDKERGLFLGSNSRTKFYLNPDKNSTECFVGINSKIPGLSSMIISPYHHVIKTATNPETGEEVVFNYNRYAITESRLSEHEKMLFKFEISNAGTMPNVAPTAIAGSDINITLGQTATLEGNGSTDPEGSTLTYKWILVGMPLGSASSVVSDTAHNPTITPDLAGKYTIQLVVFDGELYSSADAINIIVS